MNLRPSTSARSCQSGFILPSPHIIFSHDRFEECRLEVLVCLSDCRFSKCSSSWMCLVIWPLFDIIAWFLGSSGIWMVIILISRIFLCQKSPSMPSKTCVQIIDSAISHWIFLVKDLQYLARRWFQALVSSDHKSIGTSPWILDVIHIKWIVVWNSIASMNFNTVVLTRSVYICNMIFYVVSNGLRCISTIAIPSPWSPSSIISVLNPCHFNINLQNTALSDCCNCLPCCFALHRYSYKPWLPLYSSIAPSM